MAKTAFMEQRVKFGSLMQTAYGSAEPASTSNSSASEFLPAHLHSARNHSQPSFANTLANSATKKWNKFFMSGKIDARNIVAVHRAVKEDPFAKGQLGTQALRSSRDHYVSARTFSLVLASHRFPWSRGHAARTETSSVYTFDLETETEGEYWLVFRGFLQLQRDVAVGKMATQRSQGFGTHGGGVAACSSKIFEKGSGDSSDGCEEKKKSGLSKILRFLRKPSSSSSLSSVEDEPARPAAPPPDYFLGFNSPGTQVWARLRQAGLETKRVYALDTKRVMIKLRCPAERLEDVAEVLRMKLKTKDGTFVAFREGIRKKFLGVGGSGSRLDEDEVVFRSSERQKIIDFIIRSR